MTAESRCADGQKFEPREDDHAKCKRCGKLVAYHSTATRETVMLEQLTATVKRCGKLVAYHSTATRETVMLEQLTATVSENTAMLRGIAEVQRAILAELFDRRSR